MTKRLRPDQFPSWYDGQSINEAAFCREFLASHKLLYTENSFFTPEGRMTDEAPLKTEIYQIIEPYASTSVPKKISNIIELLKITAHIDDFPPQTDRIHVANGTLFLDGSFSAAKNEIVRSRFPVAYNPSAASPETWLRFLSGLLYEDDIPTLQEYTGYCLIPSNKGQRMMVIKGSGGEGKSQIGT
ncbi:MAG: DNA primase, partial [Clostridia bacterium]|nr:DNA primase [Clostridia bacterium]